MKTATKSKARSLESGSPLGLARPTLDVEIACRRNCRNGLIGLMCQITTTQDIITINGSFWGPGQRLFISSVDFRSVSAHIVKILDGWPSPCCPILAAQLRDAELREYLKNTRSGRALFGELIRERRSAEQNRTAPATTHDADGAAKST